MKVIYSSNNSGGNWWLSDEDWIALEKAGWKVKWEEYRFLGALAQEAYREGLSYDATIIEFERVTGQDAYEVGCECCGPPHSFSQER
jgi:hypothetical protein